jgi:hypothetical protein
MASGIAGRVAFHLDDATTQPAAREIMDQCFSNEIPREFDRIHWQFNAPQWLDTPCT